MPESKVQPTGSAPPPTLPSPAPWPLRPPGLASSRNGRLVGPPHPPSSRMELQPAGPGGAGARDGGAAGGWTVSRTARGPGPPPLPYGAAGCGDEPDGHHRPRAGVAQIHPFLNRDGYESRGAALAVVSALLASPIQSLHPLNVLPSLPPAAPPSQWALLAGPCRSDDHHVTCDETAIRTGTMCACKAQIQCTDFMFGALYLEDKLGSTFLLIAFSLVCLATMASPDSSPYGWFSDAYFHLWATLYTSINDDNARHGGVFWLDHPHSHVQEEDHPTLIFHQQKEEKVLK